MNEGRSYVVHRIDSHRNICIMDDVILRQNWNHVIHHKLRVRGYGKNFDEILLSRISPPSMSTQTRTPKNTPTLFQKKIIPREKREINYLSKRISWHSFYIFFLPKNSSSSIKYIHIFHFKNELFTNLQFYPSMKYYKESLKGGFVWSFYLFIYFTFHMKIIHIDE